MTLQELLTMLRENILHDRSDRVSGSNDYLWTDDTLVRYIDEAQRRFAVQGLVLRDGSTDEVTLVTLEEGVTTYTLHPSVLAVISTRRSADQIDLQRVGHAMLAGYRSANAAYLDPTGYTGLPPGPPVAYSTDEEVTLDDNDAYSAVTLRVYPAPTADQDGLTLRLRVLRKPIDSLTAGSMSASPEIPVDHHLEMLDWAAYLALRIVDHDAGNPRRAEEFRAMFESHVRAARTMVLRKLFAPTPWGFGRGGFTWESNRGY